MKKLIIIIMMIFLSILIRSDEIIKVDIICTSNGFYTTINGNSYYLVEKTRMLEYIKHEESFFSLELEYKNLEEENKLLLAINETYKQQLKDYTTLYKKQKALEMVLAGSIGLNIGEALLCVGLGLLCYSVAK